MKKTIFSLLIALILSFSFAVCEEAAPVKVFVSITDETGAIVLALEEIEVTDTDNDGALTIADALSCAHAQKHEKGAEAFACSLTEYGISLNLLWGVDNGGSYGYCVNDMSAMSLSDPIKEGDHVKAYFYTDLIAWSDTYSFFDAASLSVKVNEETALTLSSNGYDEMWNPVVNTVAGAKIIVNGAETEVITSDDGACVLSFNAAGVYVVSAVSENINLVAPVCVITVAE